MKAIMFAGQGSQYKGMGKDLFNKFKRELKIASDILEYDIEELCTDDPRNELNLTQYTQPALFVINFLRYLDKNTSADFLIGHSLGEFNALCAAEVFDFELGLTLVKKRGELMAKASGGSMAAVIGLQFKDIKQILSSTEFKGIDVANYNSPNQTVISGIKADVESLVRDLVNRKINAIPLRVSAPFHSRYMISASEKFHKYLLNFELKNPKIPVISNYTAKLYDNNVLENLSSQISNSVRWIESIQYLMGQGVNEFEEVGGQVLSKFTKEIQETCQPLIQDDPKKSFNDIKTTVPVNKINGQETKMKNNLSAFDLGDSSFKRDYKIKYAYLVGAMYRGIASKELIVKLTKAKLMGFLGTGGMTIQEVEDNIHFLNDNVEQGSFYGLNLLHQLSNPAKEFELVELYLKHGIKFIEASAFLQITPALVYFRLKGMKIDSKGKIYSNHFILAKVSRPEVAEAFMRPSPEKIVEKLFNDGFITQEERDHSHQLPLSEDICVEADSGGHTDRGVALTVFPSIQFLRDQIQKLNEYDKKIRVGFAGGIGTPQSAACAFIMGADFILTGSINQCTVEAGMSDLAKDMLQNINVQDTDYAPAGDMFEIGAKVQVLKKGVLFPARANKLFALYNQYESLDEIPWVVKDQIEKKYFKRSLESVWNEVIKYFEDIDEKEELVKAQKNEKHKMALIFRWYFAYSSQLAFSGSNEDVFNYQIHTGSALGAFNQWVKGTNIEDWRRRHVDQIGIKLMEETTNYLSDMLNKIKSE